MCIEGLHHHEADGDGVSAGPRSRLVVKEAELGRQVVLVLLDVAVDAGCIGVEARALFGVEMAVDAGCDVAQLKDALGNIVRDERGAEDFRECAAGVATEHVHLPEAILCGDVALGEEEIGL